MAEENEYKFNADPAIKNFTWPELLEYNKAFLRGEKKATFYHAAPLLADQVPADLIRLHDLGVFTDDGQGTEIENGYNEEDKRYYEVQQRAYLDGYMPIHVARKFILEARKDNEVIFEVSQIQTGKQLYLSPQIRNAWTDPGYLSLTRHRTAPTEEELTLAKWDDFTINSGPMLMMYTMENQKFKNWYHWVCHGLCYFFITDKDYGQEPKSMAARVINYLTAAGGGGSKKRKTRFFNKKPRYTKRRSRNH